MRAGLRQFGFGPADERPYRRLTGDWIRLTLAVVLVAVTSTERDRCSPGRRPAGRVPRAACPGHSTDCSAAGVGRRLDLGHRAGRRSRPRHLLDADGWRSSSRSRADGLARQPIPRIPRRRPQRVRRVACGVHHRESRTIPDHAPRGHRRARGIRFTLRDATGPPVRAVRPRWHHAGRRSSSASAGATPRRARSDSACRSPRPFTLRSGRPRDDRHAPRSRRRSMSSGSSPRASNWMRSRLVARP